MIPALFPRSFEDTSGDLRMSVELANICNLHCSYCVRDEDDLYHSPATFFPVDLLRRIVRQARDAYEFRHISFTGGEVTLHPRFNEILDTVVEAGLEFSFVTNGWHFDRVYPSLLAHKDAVRLVAFSLDGVSEETHDRWRGRGSFVRVVRAITRCRVSGIPFILKVGIRRDTVSELQNFAIFAARLGASGLHFTHFLPTSRTAEQELALTLVERRKAEEEIAILSNIFKMRVGMVVGYYNADPAPPCSPLNGKSCNIDFHGRLTLCCNLSGYRGAEDAPDVVADLTTEDFAEGFDRIQRVAAEQNERRRRALASFTDSGREIDLYTSSPCLFCLQTFGKIPWRGDNTGDVTARSLPVINQAAPSA